jgi:hypothetical protein
MLTALKQLVRNFREADRTGRPVDEVQAERAAQREAARAEGMSRRKFLVGAGTAAEAILARMGR